MAGRNGHYTAELAAEWAAWGPVGGYVAAILSRAALAHGSFPRVASLTCHFLSVGKFAPVALEVTTLRRAKRAESVRVTMSQDGRPIAEALVWLVADGLDGLVHDVARMPDVPAPGDLPSLLDRLPADAPAPASMWRNIDSRPTVWYDGVAREPYAAGWYRFPAHTTDDVSRQLIVLDVMAWSAAGSAHSWDSGYVAPNLDLSVQFHRAAVAEEWLFVEGFADVAEDGLIGFRTRAWAGRLLATATGQLLCRRV